MIAYYSGAVRAEYADRLGFMMTPWMGNALPAGASWAADNGCFTRPDRFDLDEYLAWLDRRRGTACILATAPDVVGDAPATLARSVPVLPLLRDLGYPAALVAQDGLEELPVPWDALDVLFIGGTTEWKLGAGARALVAEAKRRGKWAHMGRVNSGRRLVYAQAIGCDSADGTYLALAGPGGYANVLRWLDLCAAAVAQAPLPGLAA